jgi:hypothetical protein
MVWGFLDNFAYTYPCKYKAPENQGLTLISAERQGLEPWRQLPVDRLAICSITTLAPLQGF